MTLALGVIVVGLAFFGLILGLQTWMIRKARALEGQPVPEITGPLAKKVAGDTLLWFHSASCGPCKAMLPAAMQLEAKGLLEIVDIQQHYEVARAFGVMATPTTVLIRGGQIIRVIPGVLSPAALAELAE